MEQNLFGQILINFNLITQEQLDKVVEIQKKSNPPRLLGELLVEQGYLDDKSLKSILSGCGSLGAAEGVDHAAPASTTASKATAPNAGPVPV